MKAEIPGHLPFPPFTDWFGWSEIQRNHEQLRCHQKQSPSICSMCYRKYHLHSHPSWSDLFIDFEGIILRKNNIPVHMQFRDPNCHVETWYVEKLNNSILANQGRQPQDAAICYTGAVLLDMKRTSSACHHCQCKDTHVLLPKLFVCVVGHGGSMYMTCF